MTRLYTVQVRARAVTQRGPNAGAVRYGQWSSPYSPCPMGECENLIKRRLREGYQSDQIRICELVPTPFLVETTKIEIKIGVSE